MLDAIDSIFGTFKKIVIPHATLGWLFEEKQRIQFHQPSKVADAQEIKRLLDAKALQKFESTVAPNSELAAEIGDELAALFVEAEADFGEDRRRRLVVRSPLYTVWALLWRKRPTSAITSTMSVHASMSSTRWRAKGSSRKPKSSARANILAYADGKKGGAKIIKLGRN